MHDERYGYRRISGLTAIPQSTNLFGKVQLDDVPYEWHIPSSSYNSSVGDNSDDWDIIEEQQITNIPYDLSSDSYSGGASSLTVPCDMPIEVSSMDDSTT